VQRHDDIVADRDLIREPPELARPVGYHIVGVVGVGRFERQADAVTCVVATDIAQFGPADESEALGEGSLLSFAFFAASDQPRWCFDSGWRAVAHNMNYAALVGLRECEPSLPPACRAAAEAEPDTTGPLLDPGCGKHEMPTSSGDSWPLTRQTIATTPNPP